MPLAIRRATLADAPIEVLPVPVRPFVIVPADVIVREPLLITFD